MGKSNLQQNLSKMVFTKYVEVGRIVFVPSKKTIFTVVDVIDKNHVIIDSPTKDSRQKNQHEQHPVDQIQVGFSFRCQDLHRQKSMGSCRHERQMGRNRLGQENRQEIPPSQ